jgi:hypothetical protein
MKNAKQFVVVAMALLFVMPLLHAQSLAHVVRATIPFEFTVAGKTRAPGDYVITATQEKVITVKGDEGGNFALTLTNSAQTLNPVAPKLVFRRFGEGYYLAQVWLDYSGYGREISAPREKTRIAYPKDERQIAALVIR